MIGKPLFYTGTFCAVLVIAMVIATRSAVQTVRHEVARVRSPDGAQVALVVEIERDRPVFFNYRVYLQQGDSNPRPVAFLAGAKRGPCAFGVNPRWVDSGHLSIEYWRAISVQHLDREGGVAVSLLSGRLDPDAPPGAMHPGHPKVDAGCAR